MTNARDTGTLRVAILGGCIALVILIVGTMWVRGSASMDAEQAVDSVSLLYLDELAGRHKQVVEENLQAKTHNLGIAAGLANSEDLSDLEHLRAYELRIAQLYEFDTFAFVDEDGSIFAQEDSRADATEYGVDFKHLANPVVSVLNEDDPNKTALIAIPIEGLEFGGKSLVACFMTNDMQRMLHGLSIESHSTDATFCNLYTREGKPLTNVVLGGHSHTNNLLEALDSAGFEQGHSVQRVRQDFAAGREGVTSFTSDGMAATLKYAPIKGTDWFLTYLMRKDVVAEQISSVTNGIVIRSLLKSVLVAAVLVSMFCVAIFQTRKNTRLTLAQQTTETESRIKQQELEDRLELQNRLLQQESLRAKQDEMITALSSDYRSVYYVDLDADTGTCYRMDAQMDSGFGLREGDDFPYFRTFESYGMHHVAESYREEFLQFIDPDSIRQRLVNEPLIAIRYLSTHGGRTSFEMLRMAGVRHIEDRDDGIVHAIGVGFSDIDDEMRAAMTKNQALSEALTTAEAASRAKTAFLSNMSHEIRTPMNAIIGLDSIALQEPDVPERTRDQLLKIGESAEHLLNLINDILDMSHIESGQLTLKSEEFSFVELMEQVGTMFATQCAERRILFESHVEGQLDERYMGDETKLRQVLINILGNAVKFTNEGGTVALRVRRVAQFEHNSTLQFEISDTGIGISDEFLPHLYDAFTQEDSSSTNKYGSSGLGMAITKSLVEKMDGDIQVKSKKGVGTTFTVTITLVNAGSDASQGDTSDDGHASGLPAPDAQHADLAGRRVLVAEDVDINAEILEMILSTREVLSERATNGADAVSMFAEHEAGYYDAILMDIRMPKMDGLESTAAIRSMEREDARAIPIIALTANAFDEDVRRSLQAGLNAHLSKPVEPEDLFQTLERLI